MSAELASDWLEKLIVAADPSLIGPLFASVAVGARFRIDTDCIEVLLFAVPSFTCAETMVLFGPSSKLHWKLPLVLLNESELATLLPLVPQLVFTEAIVSPSGSLIE